MPTRSRYAALQWFLDHDVLGPDGVFDRKPPTTKMRKLMARENQLMRVPIGQFEFGKWLLTPHGRDVLLNKPKPRRKADARKPTGE